MSEHAIGNAKAWLETIMELNARWGGDDKEREAADDDAHQMPLSIDVRSDWHLPGEDVPPAEYQILLSTGGPALRVWGDLSEYGEPMDHPSLQWQDWGTPWTTYALTEEEQAAVWTFARCFYFGG